jgi:hypothetical protein
MKKSGLFIALMLALLFKLGAQKTQLAVLKYEGGGDWYANPTALPNLLRFCQKEMGMNLNSEVAVVEPGSAELYRYPFVHATGHGNFKLSNSDIQQLRTYLLAGGFLHIDDNYGMDSYVRAELKRLFPDKSLEALGRNHPIFKSPYSFPQGLPKIHEHDGKAPEALALMHEGRMLVLYTFECDLGDGWEDPEVHGDSPETRLKALRMGANILHWVFGGK